MGCTHCGSITTGQFAEAIQPGAQYGSGVKAFGVYALVYQLLPLQRTQELFRDVFKCPLSEGTLVNIVQGCVQLVTPIQAQVKNALRLASVAHFDETGLRIAGKLHWLHNTRNTPSRGCTLQLTYYAIDPKRAGLAFTRIGILPKFQGVAVHDAVPSYMKVDIKHALCNAHLLRELVALEEHTPQRWPSKLKGLLIEMKDEVALALTGGATQLPLDILERLESNYDRLVKRALQANPRPQRQPGQKGRIRGSPATNLAERLHNKKTCILRFIYDFNVPFDNNLAERDIRMTKVKQKISGGFRTVEGAEAFATIRGYISTLRKQGHAPVSALRQLFDGNPVEICLA